VDKGPKSVEGMERWGIAMGMALQEEEGKVEGLQAEVERLKGVIREKDMEIEELESGL
jgi:predicted RNase H-like nuclease (RuvC/YqgF family)